MSARIAVVGRPNVGKSTLFNRMVGGRPALVHDQPGLTRDRRYGTVDYFGAQLEVIDTGGLDPSAEGEVIGAGIHRQAWRAIEEADALLLVVDGSAGLAPLDEEVVRQVRATGKPILLAVNKIDGPKRDLQVNEFYGLGLGQPWPVSAAHGRGVDAMLEALVALLGVTPTVEDDDAGADAADGEIDDSREGDPEFAGEPDSDEALEDDGDESDQASVDDADEASDDIDDDGQAASADADDDDADDADEADDERAASADSDDEPEEHRPRHHAPAPVRWPRPADREERDRMGRADAARGPVRIAFLGKPNAGKSSLTNRLLGEERSLVHHAPGTTTDPVDSPLTFGGREYVLVDTAGIRRRARIDDAVEKLAVSMALGQIERADVVVLVMDASLGPSEQDARLAGAAAEAGKALVLALNKSDLLRGAAAEALKQSMKDNFHFLTWAPTVMLSAARGDGVDRLMDAVHQVSGQHRRRISTSELNRFFAEVCEVVPPPIWRGKAVRINFIVQAAVRPPSFVLMTNQPAGVSPAYQRFLANQLRKRYGFRGTPLRIFTRARADRHKR